MYKIIYRNLKTNEELVQYGFAKKSIDLVHSLINDEWYEIVWLFKLSFKLKTFKKCLTNYQKKNIIVTTPKESEV